MIDLSPNYHKDTLKYARRNATLLSWLIGIMTILILATGTLFVGQFYLTTETKRFSDINTNIEQELKDKDLEGTLKTIQNISNNLKLIVQVLSKQIIFSDLIKQIGAVMPENTVLSNIELSKVEGGLDLTAEAKDHNTATQIQLNLADPANKLFDKVDIVSINCAATIDLNYPCKVSLRALFAKNTPFTDSQELKKALPNDN